MLPLTGYAAAMQCGKHANRRFEAGVYVSM
jgi:hypothetical protein